MLFSQAGKFPGGGSSGFRSFLVFPVSGTLQRLSTSGNSTTFCLPNAILAKRFFISSRQIHFPLEEQMLSTVSFVRLRSFRKFSRCSRNLEIVDNSLRRNTALRSCFPSQFSRDSSVMQKKQVQYLSSLGTPVSGKNCRARHQVHHELPIFPLSGSS